MPTRRPLLVVLAGLLTALLVLQMSLTGRREAGPVLLKVTHTHGLHDSDLTAIGLWAIGLLCCWLAWDRP